jgi:hypothetical protein
MYLHLFNWRIPALAMYLRLFNWRIAAASLLSRCTYIPVGKKTTWGCQVVSPYQEQ